VSIKYLPRTPRLPNSIEDSGSFVKALYNILLETSTTVNAILDSFLAAGWTAPPLHNNWVNYGDPYAPAGYMLDASGFVHFKGAVKDGTAGMIFVLPAGYRPVHHAVMTGMSASYTACRVDVATDGTVTAHGYNNAFVSLDGINFKAAT
jgi:hypothetical protein